MKPQKFSASERLEQALQDLPRVAPAPDLSARILAQLPPMSPAHVHARALGAAALAAGLLGLALAYQMAVDFYNSGALDLLASYTAQPAIVTTYPGQALRALASAIPWLMVAASTGVLGAALFLVYRLTGTLRVASWRRA